ncbi:MAG: histidinol-phosphate transaminase [Pseudomonadales bacterium]|nr:histidinol-phosphate transaminase [Pseudomonadales bacterium]
MTRPVEECIEQLVRADVRASAAYHVPDSQGMVKLDAMENPYPWPELVLDALSERIRDVAFNRYPDSHATALKTRIRTAFGIDPRWEILLGNGSDEIIQVLITALAGPGCRVLAPAPSFVMFRLIAQWSRVGFDEVALGENFMLDATAMLDAIQRHQPQLIFLACPNNPTGNLFDEAALRVILEASTGLVVIDEAYSAFSARDHLSLLAQYPNLLIMRTLSKLGFAALRLGYLIGDPRWIAELEKVRLPYNIGTLNQLAASVALEHFELLREQTRLLVLERERVYGSLQADSRLQCWPSDANFILVRTVAGGAAQVHAALRSRGVLVKCLHGTHPMLAECLRLTVGTPAENDRLLAELDQALGFRDADPASRAD